MEWSCDHIVAINYEGGKIVSHVRRSSQLIAYANCQFVMDAPYAGRVAHEAVRANGRSEEQFIGYDPARKRSGLRMVLMNVKDKHLNKADDVRLIVQIARGRSSLAEREDFEELLRELAIPLERVLIFMGYRSSNYVDLSVLNESPFVFINVGMIGMIQNDKKVLVGQLCHPVLTFDIEDFVDGRFAVDATSRSQEDSSWAAHRAECDILADISDLPMIVLFGLADHMKFVTPTTYPFESVQCLLEELNLKHANN